MEIGKKTVRKMLVKLTKGRGEDRGRRGHDEGRGEDGGQEGGRDEEGGRGERRGRWWWRRRQRKETVQDAEPETTQSPRFLEVQIEGEEKGKKLFKKATFKPFLLSLF